jgi:hypothetical protein
MVNEEKKPEDEKVEPPAGDPPVNPPAPNQPTSEELQKKIKELEDRGKEQDAKLADAQTTLATIEARKKEMEAQKLRESTDAELQGRIQKITENLTLDPATAGAELASVLKEVKTKAAQDAVREAMSVIQGQTFVEKIRMGIKTANPDLDDDLVSDIFEKANVFASTNKYKSAEEAVEAATKYVKGKLDSYAQKKNASPKLPDGARAEGGAGNQLPSPPPPVKEVSALEELEQFNEAKARKAI